MDLHVRAASIVVRADCRPTCSTVRTISTRLVSRSSITPGFEHVAVQWGIWLAGGIAVPLPMSHPPAELDYLIRDSEASIVVADADERRGIEPLAHLGGAKFLHEPNRAPRLNRRP